MQAANRGDRNLQDWKMTD